MQPIPIRTTVIGSYPFPGWLEFAVRNLDAFGNADKEEMIEDAVIAAIHDQVTAGLDVITDGEVPADCPIQECLIDTCSTYDLKDSKPVCRFGRCTFSKINCNPNGVICKSLPPTCGPGTLPTINANGDCWSGQCAPIEACNWAPDCASCVDKEDPLVCVFKAQKGAYHVCEPKPVDCGDVQDIDCGCGQQICDASPPHIVCHDNKPDITCECPNC